MRNVCVCFIQSNKIKKKGRAFAHPFFMYL